MTDAMHRSPAGRDVDPGRLGGRSNDDHFVTTWRLAATREEIAEVLGDAAAPARWWPSVYLEVRHEAGDPSILAAIPAPRGPAFPHNLRR